MEQTFVGQRTQRLQLVKPYLCPRLISNWLRDVWFYRKLAYVDLKIVKFAFARRDIEEEVAGLQIPHLGYNGSGRRRQIDSRWN